MTSLFCLTEERRLLLDEVEARDGELDAYLDQYLTDNQLAIEQKLENYVYVLKELDARAKARADAVEQLGQLIHADLAARDRMKARLLEAMQAMGLKRVDTASHRVSVAGNGGKLPLRCTEEDASKLPEEFRRVVYVPNTDAMRKALEAGREDVPARFGERGVHLSIK